jgi:hypothetical protein
MQIRDAKIVRIIERISEHYRANISNRFIRPVLLQLPLEKQVWDQIELLTERVNHFQYQGYLLDELYRETAAAARFVAEARSDIVPTLKRRIEKTRISPSDKVLQDMAVNAFESNLRLFADLINELYISLVEVDKKNAGGYRPLYTRMPELQDIGSLLVGK